MARFDVLRERRGNLLLLDCQSDLLGCLSTRFVVPLKPVVAVPRATRLNPVFEVEGEKVVMATQLASSVAARDLSSPITSLDYQHIAILDALDMLITGY